MTSALFPNIRSSFLQYRDEPNYCNEEVTIASGAALSAGTVVGKVLVGAAVGASVTGGTGDAAISSVATLSGSIPGVYNIKCIKKSASTSADDAEFSVVAPDGEFLGVANQTVAFANKIAFTIGGDTSAASAVGDAFTVTVAAGTGYYKRIDLTAIDGTATAAGVLLNDAASASVAVKSAIIARGPAILVQDGLTYNSGATAGNKVTINAQLNALDFQVDVAAF